MRERAEQDLALIRRLMEESRRDVVDRGRHFLIWGPLSAAGLVMTYLAATGALGVNPVSVWLVVLAIGWTGSFVVGWRDGRRARVRTVGGRLLSGVWISAGGTLTVVALAGMFGPLVDVRALPGLLSVVIALPVLLTALLTGERWLVAVAAGWWSGGAVMLFAPGLYTLLLMAAMALLLMVVPGVVLHARSRRTEGAIGPVPDAG